MANIIEVKDLTYKIPNGKYIYKNLNLILREGDYVGLLGRNGVGKTTLLDLFIGLKCVVSGEVRIFGEDPVFSKRNFFKDTAYISQDVTLDMKSIADDFIRLHSAQFGDYDCEKLLYLIDHFKIDTKIPIGTMSTGYKNLVQFAMQMARNPRLVIIDEITSVLDPENRYKLHNFLQKENKERNCSIIIATNIAETNRNYKENIFR